MPKISVIVPAFCSENFLPMTIDNLKEQSLKDIEIIIIDDGSTDNTRAIIEKYMQKNDNIKGIFKKNEGVFAARNDGLKIATGKYVIFQDADDLFAPDSLLNIFTTAEKNDLDITLGRFKTFDKAGEHPENEFAKSLAETKSISPCEKKLLFNFMVSNKLYKREFLIKSGVLFSPVTFCEEGLFFMQNVFCEPKIGGCTGFMMLYRRHTKEEGLSVSQTINLENAKNMMQALSLIKTSAFEFIEKTSLDFDKKAYIDEIDFKTLHILLGQFYREFWSLEPGALSFIAKSIKSTRKNVSSEKWNALKASQFDLDIDHIKEKKDDVKKHPQATFILKPPARNNAVINSLFCMSSPFFEIIAQKGDENIPLLNQPNVTLLDKKGFLRHAKQSANSKNIVVLNSFKKVNQKSLKLALRLIPKKLSFLFSPLFKLINFLSGKIK